MKSRYARLKEYYEASEVMWSLPAATPSTKYWAAQRRFDRAIKALEPKRPK